MSKKLRELLTKRDGLDTEMGTLSDRGGEIAASDDQTDELRTEFTSLGEKLKAKRAERVVLSELIASEREADETRQAAAAARLPGNMPSVAPEDRERIELRSKARVTAYVSAALDQRAVADAEADFNAACNISGNKFPLELLAPKQRAARAEDRAATGVDTAVMPRRWLDRLFAGTASQAVGITMESVAPGIASFPVTTAGAGTKQRGKSQAADDAAWTLSVAELRPKRNAVRLLFNTEDAARIPTLESALTRDLSMALVEGIDRTIFLGDDAANPNAGDIVGLAAAPGLVEKTISQANKIKGPNTLKVFAELIDGKAAMSPADLKFVLAVGANTLWSHSLANSGASVDTTISEFLRRWGMSWITRGEIEAATAADDFAAFVGLGRGLDGAGVAAVWEAGELIRDPYSGAAKGEVALTLCYLWDFGLPRASNFARVTFAA